MFSLTQRGGLSWGKAHLEKKDPGIGGVGVGGGDRWYGGECRCGNLMKCGNAGVPF